MDTLLGVAPQNKSKSKFLDAQHIKYKAYDGQSQSSEKYIMGNISTSCYVPTPRTIFNSTMFWLSKKLNWVDFELSDHRRDVLKTTFTLERAKAPANSIRTRLAERLKDQPSSVGMLWTSRSQMTTALSITVEHV